MAQKDHIIIIIIIQESVRYHSGQPWSYGCVEAFEGQDSHSVGYGLSEMSIRGFAKCLAGQPWTATVVVRFT